MFVPVIAIGPQHCKLWRCLDKIFLLSVLYVHSIIQDKVWEYKKQLFIFYRIKNYRINYLNKMEHIWRSDYLKVQWIGFRGLYHQCIISPENKEPLHLSYLRVSLFVSTMVAGPLVQLFSTSGPGTHWWEHHVVGLRGTGQMVRLL